jgi:beta-1,4-mannosyltransferase
MIGSAPPEIEVLGFSWSRALLGSYDVLHVHWPELLVRQRTLLGRLLKELSTSLLLLRLDLTETPVVRTVHGLAHQGPEGRLASSLLSAIDRRTALWIRLDPTTRLPEGVRQLTIPHGDYRSVFPPDPRTVPERGRLAHVGRIRRDKGVERLLDVFATIREPTVRLAIVGAPEDAALADRIVAFAATDDRVEARLETVPDELLAHEVRRAELVVLPCHEVCTSPVALLALSLERPVLVPRGAVTDALAREVGDGWVIMYDGELRPADLHRALAVARLTRQRGTRPHLDDRGWELVGRRLTEAYRKVAPLAVGW